MKSGKSQIIWIPSNSLGKIRNITISPYLLRIFSLITILCVCSVPFLESRMISLRERVTYLEQNERQLHAEILTLRYVKRELGRIEEKERMLRSNFGMEKFKSLEMAMGIGGESDMESLRASVSSQSGNNFDNACDISLQNIRKRDLPFKLKKLISNIEILNHHTMKLEEKWGNTPSIMPVDIDNPRVSSGFGWRESPFTGRKEFHSGIDVTGPARARIIAPGKGVVLNKGYNQWLGNYLVLQHNEIIKTIYGHLEKITVDKGIRVNRGDQLGFMGNTGLSTSRHLHYMVVVNDRAVNPTQFILDISG